MAADKPYIEIDADTTEFYKALDGSIHSAKAAIKELYK